jgi:hypothetical protein
VGRWFASRPCWLLHRSSLKRCRCAWALTKAEPCSKLKKRRYITCMLILVLSSTRQAAAGSSQLKIAWRYREAVDAAQSGSSPRRSHSGVYDLSQPLRSDMIDLSRVSLLALQPAAGLSAVLESVAKALAAHSRYEVDPSWR